MEASGKRYLWHSRRGDVFRIWNIADIHLLNAGCAINDLKRDLQEIAQDPMSFWLGGGDMVDFIGYRDKRFDPQCVSAEVPLSALGDLGQYGMRKMRDLFRPIRHKCLGLLLGNHEKHYQQANEQESLHGWLCKELGVANLGYCCLFHLQFCWTARARQPVLMPKAPPRSVYKCDWSVRVFAHHGAGYAQTPGGKLNRLLAFMDSFDADLVFCGHVHDHVARKQPILGINPDGTKIVERQRLGLVSGSYLKTYAQGTMGYGEIRGYRPTSLGSAVAELCPGTKTMRAAI